ncbi:GNAT family N-acetyltransferase [Sphingomonas sp. GlSt437]|uniref:GNAT family N-acetyltransferase n=1 Tax=Sphingomonas sp. GlSt437 TaxID=3389970 RepID=UPI003A8B5721
MAEVHDNTTLHRFELVEDGHLAFAEYRIEGGVITFTHTIVPPEIGGRGVASRLIGAALASARARGLKVVPQCSFVAAYIERHPDERDLLI